MIAIALGFFFAFVFVAALVVTIYSYFVQPLLDFIEIATATIFVGLTSYACFTFSNWEVDAWFAVASYVTTGVFLLVNVGKRSRTSSPSSFEWTEDDIGT